MKSRIFITFLSAIILFSCISYQADAQTKVKRVKYNNTLTINPLGLMFGYLPVTYEKALKNDNTVTGYLIYADYNSWTAINIGGSYRWYFTTKKYKPNEGLSAGPMIMAGYWGYDAKLSDGFESGMTLGLGVEGAYKLIIDKGFTVEPIIQFHYPVLKPKDLKYIPYSFGFNLGYSW